jgi:hypothetical protein
MSITTRKQTPSPKQSVWNLMNSSSTSSPLFIRGVIWLFVSHHHPM